MKFISIIVCTYNRQKYLAEVLESIKNQSSAKDLYETIVINNNSTDNTLKVCEQFKTENPELNFRFFTETKQGLSHAKNRGIEEAKGDFIVFVDDDAFVNEQYIEKISIFINSVPEVKVIGGKIIPVYEEKPNWISPYLEPIFGKLDMGESITLFTGKNFPFGGNSGAAKDVFEKFGNFNPELGRKGDKMLASEEKDFYARIKSAKIKMYYLPDMILYHHAPKERTTPEFIKKQAIGIGQSEKFRAKQIGILNLGKSHFTEMLKWIATFGISTIYLFSGKIEKAKMLLKFRFWVSKGIFGRK
jgi:glycosyltransferase involved in cell wall biosynthesis